MNYSRISRTGDTYAQQFELAPSDRMFNINDAKNVSFEFQLSNPNFHDDETSFQVETTIIMTSQSLQRNVLILKTDTPFRIRNFYLSHNTEILATCCQIAFENTLVVFTDGTKNRVIKDLLFTYDKYRLETDLETYMHGYLLKLKNYLSSALK